MTHLTPALTTALTALTVDTDFAEGFNFDHLDAILGCFKATLAADSTVTCEMVIEALTLLGETWEVSAEDDVAECMFTVAEDYWDNADNEGNITFDEDGDRFATVG